jgi:hypothetical protein
LLGAGSPLANGRQQFPYAAHKFVGFMAAPIAVPWAVLAL